MDLSQIAATLSDYATTADLPVDKWNPSHCGDINIHIQDDGTWWHDGTPIGRAALVQLFSRVLRKDPDGYVLVTPVEKLAIQVDDVPFLVTDFELTEEALSVTTNVGDKVTFDGESHPVELRLREADNMRVPYIRVRGDLWARFNRTTYYRLVDHAQLRAGHVVLTIGDATIDLGEVE